MERFLDLSMNDFQLFLLAFFRITGVMLLAPVFGSRVLPAPVKIFMALVMALLFFPLIDREGVVVGQNLVGYAGAVVAEFGLGALVGFTASLLFAAVQLGGQLIDHDMGFMMANVIDPVSNAQISFIGQFKFHLSVIVYLLLDGHHFLIAATSSTFASVPLTGMSLTDPAVLHVSGTMMQDLFETAVRIAAPAMATLFLITIAMAFMARTVPEMNIFILGFAVRIGVGLGVLALGVGIFVTGFRDMHLQSVEDIHRVIELVSPGGN